MAFDPNARLDAAESIWFKRELEAIDQRLYETIYPEHKARTLIPTQDGVAEHERVYTYRLFDKVGKARVIGNSADDLPSVSMSGTETSVNIKQLGASYGWDIFEIKAAAATGRPLDRMLADAARFAVDALLDEMLALGTEDGAAVHGLTGLLNHASVDATYALSTKSGGGTTWANGTPDEIASDVTGLMSFVKGRLKDAGGADFSRFTILVPIEQYNLIAQRRMGDGSDTTILRWLLANSPFLESIESWHRCDGAGAGATDRMVCYPRSPLVVTGLVPMEFTSLPPQERNLRFVINCVASCGGAIVRYPIAMAYADGI